MLDSWAFFWDALHGGGVLDSFLQPSSSAYFPIWTETGGLFSLHPFLLHHQARGSDLTRESAGESFRASNAMPNSCLGSPFWCSVDSSNSTWLHANSPTLKSFLSLIPLSARCLSQRRLVWFSKILCMLSEKQNKFYCYLKKLRYDHVSSLKGKRKYLSSRYFYIYFHWMSNFFPQQYDPSGNLPFSFLNANSFLTFHSHIFKVIQWFWFISICRLFMEVPEVNAYMILWI